MERVRETDRGLANLIMRASAEAGRNTSRGGSVKAVWRHYSQGKESLEENGKDGFCSQTSSENPIYAVATAARAMLFPHTGFSQSAL